MALINTSCRDYITEYTDGESDSVLTADFESLIICIFALFIIVNGR